MTSTKESPEEETFELLKFNCQSVSFLMLYRKSILAKHEESNIFATKQVHKVKSKTSQSFFSHQ